MEKLKIAITSGDDTEYLLQDLLKEIDDENLDNLQIAREIEKSKGLAGEPITTGAIITGSVIVLSVLLRLIERVLEQQHQYKTMKIVAEGFDSHPELGKILAEMAKKNSEVSISYGLAKIEWPGKDS